MDYMTRIINGIRHGSQIPKGDAQVAASKIIGVARAALRLGPKGEMTETQEVKIRVAFDSAFASGEFAAKEEADKLNANLAEIDQPVRYNIDTLVAEVNRKMRAVLTG